MKTVILVLGVFLIVITGCASLQRVGSSENAEWIPEAQKDLLNKDATVTTWEGKAHDGKIIQLNSDYLLVREEDSNAVLTLPLNKVSTIRPSRNVFPPIGGFIAGFILGGVIGAGIGSGAPVEKTNQDFLSLGEGMQRLGNTASGAMIGAAVGSVSLSMILGLTTSVTDYQFTNTAAHKTRRASKDGPLKPR